MDQIGTDNTYAIAVTQEVVDKYNPQTISDLVEIAPELRFGAEHAFFTLEGSMKYGPFCEAYGSTSRSISPSITPSSIPLWKTATSMSWSYTPPTASTARPA